MKMKTLLFALSVLFFVNSRAQEPVKFGVFDIDLMLQAMPGYNKIDSMLQIYSQDSLRAEYRSYEAEYQRLDSLLKQDSAQNKPKSVLDADLQKRNRAGINIAYWNTIAERKVAYRREQLSQPLYARIVPAYEKVLKQNRISVVLKPNTVEVGSVAAVNMFPLVAKELNIPLPAELGGGQQAPANNNRPQQGGTSAPRPAQPRAKKP